MRQSHLLCFLLLVGITTQAQDLKSALLLRGKAYTGLTMLEDLYVKNLTIGAEYRLTKHHSIGVDYIWIRLREERDVYTATGDSSAGDFMYDRNKCFQFDYRFYFEIPGWQKNGIHPYLNAFVRSGNNVQYAVDKFPFDSLDVIYGKATFTGIGFAPGIHIDFKPDGPFGLDINAGVMKRFESRSTQLYNGAGPTIVTKDVKGGKLVFVLRLNLYLYLFRN